MAADTRYRPPTKVASLEIPFLALVTRADPDWARAKRREVEYVVGNGRVFVGDPNRRGAYADD